MDTIFVEKLKLEYPLTWGEIAKLGSVYIDSNKRVKIRSFLERNGYSICVDANQHSELYKPRFVFHGREVDSTRYIYSDNYNWCKLEKAMEIGLLAALHDFEEQRLINQ